MSGVIFRHTLGRGWKSMLMWGIGLMIYGFYVTAIISDVSMLEQYSNLIATMPTAMLQMFGMPEDMTFMTTPEGFISFGYFGYILLMLAVYAVLSGLNVTANEEDQGIMDVMLSLPLPRWRIIVEKFAAYSLLCAGIVLFGFLGMWLGLQVSELPINMTRLMEGNFNILPSMLVIMAFTTCVAGFIRNRSTAATLAAAFVIVSYFLNVLASAATGSIATELARLSLFYYYDNNGVMMNGLSWVTVIGLIALAGVLVGAGMWAFQRRDVGI